MAYRSAHLLYKQNAKSYELVVGPFPGISPALLRGLPNLLGIS